MRMITERAWLSKKKLLTIGGIILGVILVVAGAWLIAGMQASADYTSKLDSFKQTTRAGFDAAIKKLEQAKDSAQRIEAIDALRSGAKKQFDARPSLPTVLGVNVANDQLRTNYEDTEAKLQLLITESLNAKSLIEFQQATTKALQDIAAKTGNTAEEQTALAEAWKQALTPIKELQVPTRANAAKQQLVTAAINTQVTIAALPELYTKKDYAGFAAKQKELEAQTAELRKVSDAFKAAAKAQDAALADSYKKAMAALK